MASPFVPTEFKLQSEAAVPGALAALAADSGNGHYYGGGTDGAIYDVDPATMKPVAARRWLCHDNYVAALAVVGNTLLSAGYDRRVVWTELSTGRKLRAVVAHDGWIRQIAPLASGLAFATAGDDMRVKLWDVTSGDLIRAFEGHSKETPEGYATALYSLAVSPDGSTLAAGDRSGVVLLWDVESGRTLGRLDASAFYTFDAEKRARAIGGVRSLAFSPDGRELAMGGIGRVTNVDGFVGPCRIEVWDWRGGQRKFFAEDKHQAVFNDLAFHPTAPWLIAGGGGDGGGLLAFWDLSGKRLGHKLGVKGHLQRVRWNTSGTQIAAAGFGGFQFFASAAIGG